ncbi:MAG: hypothetical protein WBX25_14040 [Rhodomicrobium sp.]
MRVLIYAAAAALIGVTGAVAKTETPDAPKPIVKARATIPNANDAVKKWHRYVRWRQPQNRPAHD